MLGSEYRRREETSEYASDYTRRSSEQPGNKGRRKESCLSEHR